MRAFQLLVRAGKSGLAAGTIARDLGVPASTLSGHLAILQRSGLVQSWRVERQILYAIDEKGVRGLVDFLTRDCCQGQPELCGLAAPSARRGEAGRRRA